MTDDENRLDDETTQPADMETSDEAAEEEQTSEESVVRIIPFTTYEDAPFIRSSERMTQVLRSLHRNEEAMLFSNRHGDMKIMLRSTSETTDEMMTFEIVVPHDPEDDKGDFLKRVLVDEYACVEDEAGDFVFDTCIVSSDAGKDDVDEIRDMLNFYYNVQICECHANLVKTDDANGICFQCALQSDDRESTGYACIICSDDIKTDRGLMTMQCCRQTMHRKCFNLWKQDQTKNCPVCRK